jgi:hypothetical protein
MDKIRTKVGVTRRLQFRGCFMRVISLSALALVLSLGTAFADPPAVSPTVSNVKAYYAHRQLFITPMGEAFQAPDAGQHGIDLWFAAADTDHDGRISHAEFMADAMNFFTTLDANGDNAATSAESTAYWERHARTMLEAVDMSPPVLDQPSDHASGGSEHHDNAEHSGTAYESMGHARPQGGPHSQHVPDVPRTGAARFSLLEDAEPVMSCDANFDRRVTRDEFEACAERRFREIDLNGDGYFTPDEAGTR